MITKYLDITQKIQSSLRSKYRRVTLIVRHNCVSTWIDATWSLAGSDWPASLDDNSTSSLSLTSSTKLAETSSESGIPSRWANSVIGFSRACDSCKTYFRNYRIFYHLKFSKWTLTHMQACTVRLDCWLSPVTALGLLFESMLGAKSRFAIGSSVHKIRCNLEKEKWSFFVKHHREREKKSRALGESLLKKKTHFKLFGKWTCIISGTVS